MKGISPFCFLSFRPMAGMEVKAGATMGPVQAQKSISTDSYDVAKNHGS